MFTVMAEILSLADDEYAALQLINEGMNCRTPLR